MTIAINLTNFVSGTSKDHIYEQFERLANSRPRDLFVFIVTKNQNFSSTSATNIVFAITGAINTSLLWKLWYSYTLPILAKKYKASILVNTDGVCSLRAKLVQCLFITDPGFLQNDQFSPNRNFKYLQKNTTRFLVKAATVIVSTQHLHNEFSGHYNISSDKLIVVPIIMNPYYGPLQWKEKEAVRETFAEGKEYFLFNGTMGKQANLINLLKAFSLFKKRQKSNMQLLIATWQSTGKNELIESLKSYKYRDEVKLLFSLPGKEIAKITAAAYAFVYPVWHENFPLIPLQVIQCETPVILSDTSIFREIAHDAALYVQPGKIDHIAEKMMLLFKNETQREELIIKSKYLAKEYRKTDYVGLLWDAITKRIDL